MFGDRGTFHHQNYVKSTAAFFGVQQNEVIIPVLCVLDKIPLVKQCRNLDMAALLPLQQNRKFALDFVHTTQ